MRLNNNMIIKSIEDESLIEEMMVRLPEEYVGYTFKPYTPKIGEYGTIIAQYKKAMRRHSSWVNDNLFYHLTYYRGGRVYKWKRSYIIANNSWSNDIDLKVIKVSHFAPYSLREGMEFLEELLYCRNYVVLAVTDYLANMLDKLGYIYVTSIPQWFAGQYVEKQVFINKIDRGLLDSIKDSTEYDMENNILYQLVESMIEEEEDLLLGRFALLLVYHSE